MTNAADNRSATLVASLDFYLYAVGFQCALKGYGLRFAIFLQSALSKFRLEYFDFPDTNGNCP